MSPALPSLEDLRFLWEGLPEGLLGHLTRVSGLAGKLAQRWGVDPEAAELAGFLHDLARAQTPQGLLERARTLDMPVDPVEEQFPLLLHGRVGARVVEDALETEATDVLAAIAWHSTARWGMSDLEKVVFLADKLDPGKQDGHYPPGLEALDELACSNLNGAVVFYLDWQIRHLLDRGRLVHLAAIDARNALLIGVRA